MTAPHAPSMQLPDKDLLQVLEATGRLEPRMHMEEWQCKTGRCTVCRSNDRETVETTLGVLQELGWTLNPPCDVEAPHPGELCADNDGAPLAAQTPGHGGCAS